LAEEERHKAFQALRKKHYEMKDAIKLGHQLEEEEEEEEENNDDEMKTEEEDSNAMVNGHV
jgi:hypothetical protein